ncbi:MAG: lantibiotic immunity ABC transporter MutE/EpiE family permease subunit [Lachnospiraceae bacterium]|nr:lantibiotic immunity ABC transporter MutE/EpiE family permease subunit [Lachnospiraceae bacterium]
MKELIRAERLKLRHSFGSFLPLSAAVLQVMISLFLSMGTSYYSVNAWNWWYTMILPGMLSVLCYLGIKQEKKQHYANMLTTQIAPDRCWMGKILYYAIKLLWANLLIFVGTAVGGILIGTTIPVANGFAAALLLSICYLWEIPLYMALSARFGMFAAVCTCMTITVGSLITLGASKLWWVCPASVPFRLMCPVLQIMPNGLIVESDSRYMSTSVIFPGIMISLFWFTVLTCATTRWFRGMYDRKESI